MQMREKREEHSRPQAMHTINRAARLTALPNTLYSLRSAPPIFPQKTW